jgi:hypothetical protein
MWHRFSVALAVVTLSGVCGVGSLAPFIQPALTASTNRVEVLETTEDTVAKTYVQRNRRGTGRRGVLG